MTTHDPAYGSGALDMIRDGISELSTSVVGWLETIGEDADAALSLLDDVRSRRTKLAEIEALVEAHAARVMPRNTVALDDGRLAERGPATRRTGWSHRDAAFALADAIITDPNTGEIVGDHQTAVQVTTALLDAAGIRYWRPVTLGKYGVSADQFCTRERVRRTVRISAPKAAGQ